MISNEVFTILFTVFIGIISGLMGIIGYFLKQALNRLEYRMDRMEIKISAIEADLADMKPKLSFLWEKSKAEST